MFDEALSNPSKKAEGSSNAAMNEELRTGNVEGTLEYFLESSRPKYGQLFTDLPERLPGIAAGMKDIEMLYSKEGRSKYRIRRDHDINGNLVRRSPQSRECETFSHRPSGAVLSPT